MNILALDTITPTLTVSTFSSQGTSLISVHSDTQSAEKIIDVIEKTLNLSGLTVKEIQLIVCAEGPGSFTGLRLAYSTAKALQLAANCALLPIPTLLCYAFPFASWPGVVISVLDAKKKRFYVQVFRKGKAITDSLDISVPMVMEYIDPAERILITGPDASLFSSELSQIVPNLDTMVFPNAQFAFSDILKAIAENTFPYYNSNILDHSGPVYVRKSDAETNNS